MVSSGRRTALQARGGSSIAVAVARGACGAAGVVGRHAVDEGQRRRTEGQQDPERTLHAAIKKVTQAVTDLRFNTAIAEMMVFVNGDEGAGDPARLVRDVRQDPVTVRAARRRGDGQQFWSRHRVRSRTNRGPCTTSRKLSRAVMKLGVQVNGKIRGEIEVATDASEATILAAAKANDKVQPFLAGKAIKREIWRSRENCAHSVVS